jgi:hypothetical protein
MGFRKTRTSNGCSAIFWDDQLISVKSPAMHEACSTDPTEGGASTSSNSSVSNVHNSLSDNGLEEK